ncbi:hypothetical protein ATCV1_z398L [Acanthocystis turfacea chlorella virus 1]|uniref:Uncharacterized protein z398L n=1 Tax=Chlorovirus heliozoae TaxID=322019 RepID=A7K908_9PHYC|nr:hypothetical protein ATCV1_z398L [Acanthocystis turfacea chlorella virus 1]ABT16532.1 hypothetical protein ATCV1_z398L [Acanthocystis turfacea chlorella virus 1]
MTRARPFIMISSITLQAMPWSCSIKIPCHELLNSTIDRDGVENRLIFSMALTCVSLIDCRHVIFVLIQSIPECEDFAIFKSSFAVPIVRPDLSVRGSLFQIFLYSSSGF